MFSESVLDHKSKFDGRLERGVFWRGNFNRRNVSYTTFVRLTSKLALSTGMDLFRNGCTKSVSPYCCLAPEIRPVNGRVAKHNELRIVFGIVGFRFERKKTPMMSRDAVYVGSSVGSTQSINSCIKHSFQRHQQCWH